MAHDIQTSSNGGIAEITKLVHGGSGLGRAPDGRALFVPYTIPGDKVRYQIRREYKRYIKADLLEVLDASDFRVTPLCPVFGRCGGCDWQMLSYADQCDLKQDLLCQSVTHHLGEEAAEVLDPILPGPEHTGYRCRAQLKCGEVDGTFVLGFYRPGTHEVVDIGTCPVLHPRLNALLPLLHQLFNRSRFARGISQIDIAVGDAENVRILVYCNFNNAEPLVDWIAPHISGWEAAVLVAHSPAGTRSQEIICVQGKEELTFSPAGPELRLMYGPGDFCQVYLRQNRALVALVLELAAVERDTIVHDLYCGVGNFALPLAKRAGTVIGVEANPGAIDRASANAQANNLSNTRFIAADVARFPSRREGDIPDPDVVVLDPPRAGAKQVVSRLARSGVKRVVYVSCDQHTLLRDLKLLIQSGYSLRFMRGVDMFPHTHHCEVVALLDRG